MVVSVTMKSLRYHHFPRSGVTLAVSPSAGGYVRLGGAFVHVKDQFCRRVGRKIASERASNPRLGPYSTWIPAEMVRDAILLARAGEHWGHHRDVYKILQKLFQPNQPAAIDTLPADFRAVYDAPLA